MRFLRIDGTRRVKVAIRLLGSRHNVEDAVDISLQLLVWISLQHVAGPFDGLVNVSIIERETHELAHIPFVRL